MNAAANVWIVDVSSLNEEQIACCETLLSTEEMERSRQFRFRRDQVSYGVAHALLRLALSYCETAIPPTKWIFIIDPNGRPEIDLERGLPVLRFNIAHAAGMVACIVTRDADCGIDVEAIDQCDGHEDIAANVLSVEEIDTFDLTEKSQQAILFCRYWTLKEAYAKAIGLGLSMDFKSISFDLNQRSLRLIGQPDAWQFEQWVPDEKHVVSAAIRTNGPTSPVIHYGFPK